MEKERQSLTYYILPTASNLLGICFFILSYIKMSGRSASTLLDECVIFPMILFFIASLLSYMAMRSNHDKPRLEKAADLIFMTGLLGLSLIAIVLVLAYI